MIATLLALTINQQASSTVQLGTVDIGGNQIPVEVPARRGPFNENTPHVEIDGWKFTVSPEGNIGVRYKSDGGWGEVADAYPAAAQKAISAPEYRIKVIIVNATTILEKGHDGTWRRRRSAINDKDNATILKSLARLKALAETAADGRVRLTFNVTYDNDLLFKTAEAGMTDELLGSEFIKQDIAPQISNDPFDNEEGIYNGPYSSVFVIHSSRTEDVTTSLIERTPVTSVSWATFTNRDPGSALSVLLFNVWNEHLYQALMNHHGRAPSREQHFDDSLPYVFGNVITNQFLDQGNHLLAPSLSEHASQQDTAIDLLDVKNIDLTKLPKIDFFGVLDIFALGRPPSVRISSISERQRVYVPHTLVASFVKSNPTAETIGWARDTFPRAGAPKYYVVFELADVSNPDANDLDWLKLNAPPVRAVPMMPMLTEFGEVKFSPSGHGDFDAAFVEDPAEGRTIEITETGSYRRGHVVLASAEGSGALFRISEDTVLTFKVSCDLLDSYVLNLVLPDRLDYKKVEILLFNNSPTPAEEQGKLSFTVNAAKQPEPFWTEFKIDLPDEFSGALVSEIQISPPEYASYYERKSGGKTTLKISTISFGPMTDTDPETVPVNNPDIEWLKSLQEPLDEATRPKMKELLASTDYDVMLNALGAMTRIKDEELLPDIAIHMNSVDSCEAYLAVQAVKHLDTDLAWAMIAYVAVKGPMGHNYRFVAEALAAKPEPATLQLMNGLMLNRNWRTRRAAVQTIAKIKTEGAGVVAAVALTNDPNPIVRYEVTKQNRPDHELFTRRLLWTAVNDASEQVRLSSYLAIIDSPFDDIRQQAIRGVRDESITIRLTLLEEMKTRAKEHYRSALRFAVIDSSPFVRAAALRAFATQPGEVVAGEIQNTFQDQHPAVKQALQELAKAKNITLPNSK